MSSTDSPTLYDAGAAPAWGDVHQFWLRLMCVYAADCERAGVDNLDPGDLRYQRSYIAGFMHELIRARTSGERQRIISEASAFLAEQERRARLEPPAPMKMVCEVHRTETVRLVR